MKKNEALREVDSLTCRCCGQTLPVSQFRRYKTGTYRHCCWHCYWEHYGRACRQRRWLRELDDRPDDEGP